MKAEVIESVYNIKRKSYCHPTTSQLFCPKPDQCRSVHSFGRSVGLFFYFERIDAGGATRAGVFSPLQPQGSSSASFFVSVLAGTRCEPRCLSLPGLWMGRCRLGLPASRLVGPTARVALLYFGTPLLLYFALQC